MNAMESQITGVFIVCSTVGSGANQRKHQSSASLVFVWVIHRWIPRPKASNAENVSIWWRHHVSQEPGQIDTSDFAFLRKMNIQKETLLCLKFKLHL